MESSEITSAVVADAVTPWRVLLVEDDAGDAQLFEDMLEDSARDAGPPMLVTRVERLAKARDALAAAALTAAYDVVLLDLSLPDSRGLWTLSAVLGTAPDVPVVVLTGLADDAVATDALRAGAQDYLVKGRFDPWAVRRAIRHAVERQRLVRALRHTMHARDAVRAIISYDLLEPLGRVAATVGALLAETPDGRTRELLGQVARDTAGMRQRLAELRNDVPVDLG